MNMKRLAAIILGGTILPFLTMSIMWCGQAADRGALYGWFGLPELSGQWYQWKFAPTVDMDKHHYPEFMKLSESATSHPIITLS